MTDDDAAINPRGDHDSPLKEALEGWLPLRALLPILGI